MQPEEPEYCHPALHRATKAVIESAGGQRQAACAWQDAARGELWTADGEDWLDLHATWEDQEASDDGTDGPMPMLPCALAAPLTLVGVSIGQRRVWQL